MDLTQQEADAVGAASKKHKIEVLSDLLERHKTFTNASERLKSSDEIKADLVKGMANFLEFPAYVDEDRNINIFSRVDCCFLTMTTKAYTLG